MSEAKKPETLEEALAALTEMTEKYNTAESARVKAMEAQSRSASEVSKMKKELDAKRTEEERAAAEEAEKYRQMSEKLAEYERRDLVNNYKMSMLSLQYTDEEATKAAEALANNDTASFFAIQKAHQDSFRQQTQENLLNNTPTPPAGNPPKSDPDEMSDAEYYASLKK